MGQRLSPAFVHELQLAFAMIETPAPRARFLNFPLADEAPVAVTPRPIRRRQSERDVAA